MFKKTIAPILFALALTATPIQAQSVINLNDFNTDFGTLMTGISRDVAPTLQLGALSGDTMGDATIDIFNLSLVGVGLTTADGLGRVLKSDADTKWKFLLPLSKLVNNNVKDNNFFQSVMVYPTLKAGVGFNIGGWWDLQVTGIYVPQLVADAAVSAANDATVKKLNPQFSFGNLGVKARKTLIPDSGWFSLVPALSLGFGYTYTFYDMGMNLSSLEDLTGSKTEVSTGTYIDMSGKFGLKSFSHNATVDFHFSKHLFLFTPFVKLTGAYQLSQFAGNADLTAVISDSSNAETDRKQIKATPQVDVSRFTFLTTTGLEVNLILMYVNVNVVADMGRAFVKVRDLSLKGVDANAFSVNLGTRFAF